MNVNIGTAITFDRNESRRNWSLRADTLVHREGAAGRRLAVLVLHMARVLGSIALAHFEDLEAHQAFAVKELVFFGLDLNRVAPLEPAHDDLRAGDIARQLCRLADGHGTRLQMRDDQWWSHQLTLSLPFQIAIFLRHFTFTLGFCFGFLSTVLEELL